jgi:hypothetical protein
MGSEGFKDGAGLPIGEHFSGTSLAGEPGGTVLVEPGGARSDVEESVEVWPTREVIFPRMCIVPQGKTEGW